MVDYKWDAEGFWRYEETNEDEKLYDPLPDRSSVKNEQLPLDVSEKTLGIWTKPTRDCDKNLEVTETTIETWTSHLEADRLLAK